jgi:hypothetical protein
MCWQKTVTARGEATDGSGSNDYSWSVAASRLWADRDHAARFRAGAGGRSQSLIAAAVAGVGRGAAPLGLSDALSAAAPRRLAGQPQTRRAAVSRASAAFPHSSSSASSSAMRPAISAPRSGHLSRRRAATSIARRIFHCAITLVKALSSMCPWYSSGPSTSRIWRWPSASGWARLAQNLAVSNRISAPASSRNPLSPVARQ